MFTRTLAAAVVVGVGWATMVRAQDAIQPENAIQKTEDAFHRANARMAEPATRPSNDAAVDANGIQDALAAVTQAALSKGGFDDLIDHFSDTDRMRLSRNKNVITNHPILEARIAQFQKDWQARFNQEFKIVDKQTVYGAAFASIKQGYAPEGARLAGERILPNNVASPAPHDEIRDRDQRIATVTIAASNVAPAIDVQMVREPTGWKIDVSDTFSLQEMHDALLTQITELDQHRDTWPANVNDASRMVTRRILMGVLNIDPARRVEPMPSPNEDRVLNPNALP